METKVAETMSWTINKAILLGRDHKISDKNCQDYCEVFEDEKIICGVICDGCSEGEHSEVGAVLIGRYVLENLRSWYNFEASHLAITITTGVHECLSTLMNHLWLAVHENITSVRHISESVDFVKNYLLATLVFCVIDKINNRILIGNSGDGLVIKDGAFERNEQNDSPHYLAYQLIPKRFLQTEPSTLKPLDVQEFNNLNRIIISSDGLVPFFTRHATNELYNKKGRQLQRMFNVIQNTEKIFSDDTSCIVFEKQIQLKLPDLISIAKDSEAFWISCSNWHMDRNDVFKVKNENNL